MMRRYLSGFVLIMMVMVMSLNTANAQPTPTPTPIDPPDGWKLVWHDEFDGDTINPDNWTYDRGANGWGNNESQLYTKRPENARLENGMLVIEARKEDYQGSKFTSARLKTQGLQEFQYGRVEARLKVPAGKGLWPAFWMLGANAKDVGWPDCGEIDIMEYVGKEPDAIYGTIHGPGYSGASGKGKESRQKHHIADDFHVFAVEWDKDQISWFYDGEKFSTYSRADVGKWPFDHTFFIILNLAVEGYWPGKISPETVFPAQYLVDYVRVFQKE